MIIRSLGELMLDLIVRIERPLARAAGVVVRRDGDETAFDAPTTEVVDSTGAGDALAAGFLVGGSSSGSRRLRGAFPGSGRCRDRRRRAGLAGQALTPFVLAYLHEQSGGRTLALNRQLAADNAALAGSVATAFSRSG